MLGPEATPVGNIKFWDGEWHEEPVYEMGWGILPEYQGKGLANAVCRKAGFTLIEAVDSEYPKGHWMRCNDWRLDLAIQDHLR